MKFPEKTSGLFKAIPLKGGYFFLPCKIQKTQQKSGQHPELTGFFRFFFSSPCFFLQLPGMPCDMCELAQQLPEGGQRGDLVAGNNIQAEGFGGF